MLPLQRQREYLELKTKLALYAKKQREEEMAVKGIYIKCSGTPLIQTPMGQKKVSILVRCPEHYTVEPSNPDTNGTEESVHISEVS